MPNESMVPRSRLAAMEREVELAETKTRQVQVAARGEIERLEAKIVGLETLLTDTVDSWQTKVAELEAQLEAAPLRAYNWAQSPGAPRPGI